MFSLIAEYFQGSLQPALKLTKQCWALQTEQAVADNPACSLWFVSSELQAECLARQQVRLAAGLGWLSIPVIPVISIPRLWEAASHRRLLRMSPTAQPRSQQSMCLMGKYLAVSFTQMNLLLLDRVPTFYTY